MKQYVLFAVLAVSVIVLATAFVNKGNEHPDKHLEIVLRNIGHEVLLHSGDSTSRVLPIETVDKNTFRISFENSFVFDPDTLMHLVHQQLAKTDRPGNYSVSVTDCNQDLTIFAYEVNSSAGDLKPCRGRQQKKGCYLIEISFPGEKSFSYAWLLLALIPLTFGGLYIAGKLKPKSPSRDLTEKKADESLSNEVEPTDFILLGNFTYFESTGILSLNGETVELSPNEAKALSILTSNQNEVVERDLLMKKIWEDEGVLVITRNVDVLISKLRKRLAADPSVKIMTVHGRGYKMIV